MQSKKGSFAEATTNVAIGVSIGFVSNIVALPLFGYNVTVADSLGISAVFTAVSLVRSYSVRRVYSKYNFFSKGE